MLPAPFVTLRKESRCFHLRGFPQNSLPSLCLPSCQSADALHPRPLHVPPTPLDLGTAA